MTWNHENMKVIYIYIYIYIYIERPKKFGIISQANNFGNSSCYNQTGDITTLDGTPLKLVDKFTYLGSSVSSTEKDIDTRLTKAWTAIDRMKRSFFQAAIVSILL